jgi:molybdenum cofactor guanylyltransferase
MFGAVLCGGASRRMGRNKALIEIAGVPLAVRTADVLRQGGCGDVVLVGGGSELDMLRTFGQRLVADEWPGEGPLGGVITALRLAADEGFSVAAMAACDLPQLRSGVIASLRSLVPPGGVAVAATTHVEPMCAVWSTETLPALERAFTAGGRAVAPVFDLFDCAVLSVHPTVLLNANEPADLLRLGGV